jgi:O-succinylbenzoic acid--CoA ligase
MGGALVEELTALGLHAAFPLSDDTHSLSAHDTACLGRAAAHALSMRGVRHGQRVAFAISCDVDSVLTLLGAWELGAAVVPLHPRWTPTERSSIATRARVEHVLEPLETRALRPVSLLPPAPLAAPRPADVAAVVFTSGSSGEPKGVVLSRRALAASAEAASKNVPLGPRDRQLACLPLAHVGGLSLVSRSLASGAALRCTSAVGPSDLLAAIERERPTRLSLVPAQLARALDAGGGAVLASVEAVLVGGAALSVPLRERCADARVHALATYGLTETASQVATQAPRLPTTLEEGVGRPLPGATLEVLAPPGDVGPIRVRGPMCMDGYDRGPDAPRDGLTDGWVHTGDLGRFDERGVLHVVGREKELVITGGENVAPAEVEAALERWSALAECAVFGVPNDTWGETVAAALVPKPGVSFSLAELADAVQCLAPFKRPRLVALLPALARLPSGKRDLAAIRRDAFARLVPAPRSR